MCVCISMHAGMCVSIAVYLPALHLAAPSLLTCSFPALFASCRPGSSQTLLENNRVPSPRDSVYMKGLVPTNNRLVPTKKKKVLGWAERAQE